MMCSVKDNIDSSWQSQYEPRDNVYTGSKDDGPGDPQAGVDCIQLVQSLCMFETQVGYAPYDFESTQDAVMNPFLGLLAFMNLRRLVLQDVWVMNGFILLVCKALCTTVVVGHLTQSRLAKSRWWASAAI